MRYDVVIFDFFGTVAEHDGNGVKLADVLQRHGVVLDPALARAYWQDGFDGTTHDGPSRSREHYVEWQRERLHALLDEAGVHPERAASVAAELRAPHDQGRMVAYPDASAVLDAIAARGVRRAICSNWDWDLTEAIDQTGLSEHFDLVVSSAWIGARKPHPRIYDHMVDALQIDPARALFVGDTWSCDIAGPRSHGMTPVYVRRPHREPDHTRPQHADGVHEFDDLTPILGLLDGSN